VRATPAEISRAGAGGRGFFITASSFDWRDAFDPNRRILEVGGGFLIPFPPKHVRPEQVGHIVDFYDQNLSGAAIAILMKHSPPTVVPS
jgi:hypothetical protein